MDLEVPEIGLQVRLIIETFLIFTEGVWMLNVKFVIAVSFERIHRSNLVLFGIIPLQFKDGQDADKLGLTGKERFSVDITDAKPGQDVVVKVICESIFSYLDRLKEARFQNLLSHSESTPQLK